MSNTTVESTTLTTTTDATENETMNTTENETMSASEITTDEPAAEHLDAEEAATEEQLSAEADQKTPAWVDFIAALDAHAQALGLSVKEQKGFTKFFNSETGHKVYVAKQGREVKRVDTTLPILGQDGTYDLSKPNGKIACHVVANLETVTKVLTQLADSTVGKIRQANKKAKAEEAAPEAPAEAATPSE